ncbi:MAG TPA: hypothetical protein VMA83_08925 [Solirubrobacteraceae bacterium]|nr:hypothetical protein [Solirubrobacteraceae bacterium]
MTKVRRFGIDELVLRPGTYFNPQTEILLIVDDTPDVDNELFESEGLDGEDWVLLSEDTPLDEDRRDELVEHFQQSHADAAKLLEDEEDEDEDIDPDEDDDGDFVEDEEDELEGVEEL